MRIICTTSDRYSHLLPVFEYLYLKYWGDRNIEIVGYEKPDTVLPFVSLGTQGDVTEWSTDLRKYFATQDDAFIWIMEDTIIKSVQRDRIPTFIPHGVGKICLTSDVSKRDYSIMLGDDIYIKASSTSRYRLSTQPSIWNRDYLLKYLTDGLNPWDFETQDPMNDGWHVYGMKEQPLQHNEGVNKRDIYKVDLTGLPQNDIDHIKRIATWVK